MLAEGARGCKGLLALSCCVPHNHDQIRGIFPSPFQVILSSDCDATIRRKTLIEITPASSQSRGFVGLCRNLTQVARVSSGPMLHEAVCPYFEAVCVPSASVMFIFFVLYAYHFPAAFGFCSRA